MGKPIVHSLAKTIVCQELAHGRIRGNLDTKLYVVNLKTNIYGCNSFPFMQFRFLTQTTVPLEIIGFLPHLPLA